MRFTHWLVDFGEVISTQQATHHVHGLVELTGLDPVTFEARYWEHRPAYDAGWSTERYWSTVMDRPVDDTVLGDLLALDIESWTQLDPDMLDILDEALGAGVELSLLSNASTDFGDAIRHLPALATRFARFVISGELGVIKPDPQIYRIALDTSGRSATETLFIDDRAENVAAAETLGITAVHFGGADALRMHLDELGMKPT